jgi:nicotinate-nucleotide--dimethylbenzimidazole phosphoribosyltransferase
MNLLDDVIAQIAPPDPEFRAQARTRLETLAMPPWALGRVLDLGVDLVGMTRALPPPVSRRLVVVMAGDHGVTVEGVTNFPAEVTRAIVLTAVRGGAGINVLARQTRCDVLVVDLGVAGGLGHLTAPNFLARPVAPGTQNLARGPAMTAAQARQSLETGIRLAQEQGRHYDVFATGEMGIGNTTPAAAIAAAITGRPAAAVTGRGTGLTDAQLAHKTEVVARALAVNRPDARDGLDVLAKVGGFEIGGLAGLILGAAAQRRPVVVDGFIATAAALIAHVLCPAAGGYLIAAHRSAEGGHRVMLEHLGKSALLDLDLRLGEGTGAALAMPLLDGAAAILTEMFTLDQALKLKLPG